MQKEIKDCYKKIDMPLNSSASEVRLRTIYLKRKLLNKQDKTGKDYNQEIKKIDENAQKIYEFMKKNGTFYKKNNIKLSFDLFFNLMLLLILFSLIICFNIKLLI